MSVLGEDLHSGSFISPIAHNEFAVGSHYGNFARIPQLTLFFAGQSKLEFERAVLFENLHEKCPYLWYNVNL